MALKNDFDWDVRRAIVDWTVKLACFLDMLYYI